MNKLVEIITNLESTLLAYELANDVTYSFWDRDRTVSFYRSETMWPFLTLELQGSVVVLKARPQTPNSIRRVFRDLSAKVTFEGLELEMYTNHEIENVIKDCLTALEK